MGLLDEGALEVLRYAQDDKHQSVAVQSVMRTRARLRSFAALRMTSTGLQVLRYAQDDKH